MDQRVSGSEFHIAGPDTIQYNHGC